MEAIECLFVALTGQLTETNLAESLGAIEPELASADRACPVVLDCTKMTGYDLRARHSFVNWNKRNRDRVCCMAIVTQKPLWHMVIRAMALASSQTMRPFPDVAAAQAWVQSTYGGSSD